MGLLDMYDNDPNSLQAMQTSGLAQGLLSGRGGPALAAGLAGMETAKKNWQDRQMEQLKMAMSQAQFAQTLRQQQLANNFLQQAFGQSDSAAPQSGNPMPQQSVTTAPAAQASAPAAGSPVGGSGMPSGASTPQGGGILGLNRNAAAGGVLAGLPGMSELGKAVIAANAKTDFAKMMDLAGITDPGMRNQLAQANLSKQNYVAPLNARPGSIIRDPNDPNKILAFNPHIPDGGAPVFDANGNVTSIAPIQGSADIMRSTAAATAAGKNSAEPVTAFNPKTGQYEYTNKTAAATGAASAQTISPAGFPTISPQQQTTANAESLRILQNELDNEKDPNSRAALQRSIERLNTSQQNGTPFNTSAAPTKSALAPQPAPGYEVSQGKMAGAGADRAIGLTNSASESPTRVNVLDNILQLTNEGVQTGKGTKFKNDMINYASNIPGVSSILSDKTLSDNVKYQEINKFIAQNGIRAWQAAGGTGTDAQLFANQVANPNIEMTPPAIDKMVRWAKAGELALQAKANAQDAWKQGQGGNVVNQDQFERQWRNNFDPVLYQLKTMSPQDAAAKVASIKQTDPNGYGALMLKANALKNMGGL